MIVNVFPVGMRCDNTFDSGIENQLNKLTLKDPERCQPQHCNMSVGKNVSDKQACENEPDAGEEKQHKILRF